MGAAFLPFGLLCIGAVLDLRTGLAWVAPVVPSLALKFLAILLVKLVAARLIGSDGPALITALLCQTLPTTSSAYIMARQLGGNAPLMAGSTAAQTVLAMWGIPPMLVGIAI